MSGVWDWQCQRKTGIVDITLWLGAAVTIFAVHVGAAMWLMRQEPVVAADDSPPPAIMIELAETPEAQQTERTDITEQTQDSEQSAPSEKVDTAQEEPAEEQVTEQTVKESPEPKRRELKKPVPKKRVIDKPAPEMKKLPAKPAQPQPASEQAAQAQVQATQSNRTAAQQSASGLATPSRALVSWQSRLMAHLERRKRYPAGATRGEQGTAYVQFSIDDAGNVLSVSLIRSSGHVVLDNEVLALLKRASPVPAPPPDANKTVIAPVRFDSITSR